MIKLKLDLLHKLKTLTALTVCSKMLVRFRNLVIFGDVLERTVKT